MHFTSRILKPAILLGIALTLCQAAAAKEPVTRHQVRLGWGDMLFETLAFHTGVSAVNDKYTSDYGFTGHFFGEYMYSVKDWLGVGFQMDVEGIFWSEDNFRSRNYNLTFLPEVRFTYLRKPVVKMYSGIGAGVLLAFDNAGGKALAPAVDFTLLGIQVGKGHWSGSVQIGALNSLSSMYVVFMVASRIFSISVNYSW